MSFNLNVDGINVYLKINNYKPSNRNNWDSLWCKCDFMFSSGDWLNYHRENDEIILCSEIEELASIFTMLIDGKIVEYKEVTLIEPDFVFQLYPQTVNNSVLSDILVDWRVYFWYEGLTSNYLSITLNREEIIILRDYFLNIIKNIRLSS